MNTPVLYLVFNRPAETRASFSIIRKIKPVNLYVAADGPREKVEADTELCEEVRSVIMDNIDWECDLHTLFRQTNLGCGKAVQGALDWFFQHETRGIIIEDDIIPNDSFFKYASTLLDRYENDDRIFSINGCNLGYSSKKGSYGVTRYFNMWGWATWRRSNELVKRSWAEFDRKSDFTKGSSIINSLKMPTIWPNDRWYALWINNFKNVFNGKVDTWDYQWSYTCLKHDLYCIRPNENLVNNIGFNDRATHTKDMAGFIDLSSDPDWIDLDDRTELSLSPDRIYELEYVAEKWQHFDFSYKLLLRKIWRKVKRIIGLSFHIFFA